MKSLKKVEGGVAIHDTPSPSCNDKDVIIKMGACGICGSDLSNIFGNSCKPTAKIGHEVAGTIIKVGKEIIDFKVGDRVFVHHHASCGNCYLCRAGNHTLCEKFVDSLEPCGMAEEFLLPEWSVNRGCLFKIPDSLSFEKATIIEPLGCCIRGWNKVSHNQRTVAIFGAGPIGIIHSLLARHYGFETVFCIDIIDSRLRFVQKMGMEAISFSDSKLDEKIRKKTNYIGADIVIIATSDMSAINMALAIIRKGGTILLMGEPASDSKHAIDFSKMYEKEATIVTSYASTNDDIKDALGLIVEGIINVGHLITHKFSFEESVTAIQTANSRQDSMKVIVTGNT